MSDLLFSVDDLHVRPAEGDHDDVLRGLDLQIAPGGVHAEQFERNGDDAFTTAAAGV